MMDSDFLSWLKLKRALYLRYEAEDLEAGKDEAAYRAKLIADTYKEVIDEFQRKEL